MEQCAWSGFEPYTFPICETSVCSLVRQPANTLSNIGFFAVAIFLIFLYRRRRVESDLEFGISALLIGVCSTLAHASWTRIFGYMDFAAIFSIFSVLAAKDLRIASPFLKRFNERKLFLVIFLLSQLALLLLWPLKVVLFAGFAGSLLGWEVQFLRRHKVLRPGGHFGRILLCFLVGGVSFVLDADHVICDPDNHLFQLHTIWHLSMALSIYCLANHVRERPTAAP